MKYEKHTWDIYYKDPIDGQTVFWVGGWTNRALARRTFDASYNREGFILVSTTRIITKRGNSSARKAAAPVRGRSTLKKASERNSVAAAPGRKQLAVEPSRKAAAKKAAVGAKKRSLPTSAKK